MGAKPTVPRPLGRQQIPPDVEDWHRAVEAGDEAEVRRLMAAGASVHAADIGGRTPLMVAAGKGSARLCGLLLDAGADVGARDCFGRTALHAAAMVEGGAPVLELLLWGGADPHTQDSSGRTALHCALQTGNQAAADILVPTVDRVLQRDDTGRTVLHWAAYVGNSTVVRQLLERFASPWEKDLCGRDALIWAVESGVRTVVKGILLEGGYRECFDKKGQTALHVAAIKGDAKIVAYLLASGARPIHRDSKGRTPLMYALRGAHRHAVLLLLTKSPVQQRVHRRDRRLRTLLHWAAVGGDAVVVRELLARGANVNAVDADLKTPAHLAVEHGHEEAAAVLISADGFRVKRDCRGRTLLHGAAANGWKEVALRLVSLGADPHERDWDLLTPVQLATSAGHYQLAGDITHGGCP